MSTHTNPVEPIRVQGTSKGEEMVFNKGREPGRGSRDQYRRDRGSSSIDPQNRELIHPAMPGIPPA